MIAKNCPKCDQQVPVACKACPCGHSFFNSKKLNRVLSPGVDIRRRTQRVRREKPNYYDALEYDKQIRKIKTRNSECENDDDCGKKDAKIKRKKIKKEEDEDDDVMANLSQDKQETVQTFMRLHYPSFVAKELHHEFYFMHRLDYSTSGVMCIPLHKKACQIASRAVEHRKCKKYYLALVRGWLQPHVHDLQFPIGQDYRVKDIQKMRVCDGDSRSARTVAVPLQKGLYDDNPATKLLIRTVTGRRHQIRVHCSHIGHTIIGDYTYSNKEDTKPFRMFLHAFRLNIPNEMESLDVQTEDPFVEQNVKGWRAILDLYSLEESYRLLDKTVDTS